MPAILPLGDQLQGWITVTIDNHDGKGPVLQPVLPAGQTIAPLVSPDAASFTVALDSPAVPDPDGTPTVGSFTIKTGLTVAQPNVALPLNLTILNADGSTAAKDTDTVTVSETATEAVGDVFGTPIALVSTAAALKK